MHTKGAIVGMVYKKLVFYNMCHKYWTFELEKRKKISLTLKRRISITRKATQKISIWAESPRCAESRGMVQNRPNLVFKKRQRFEFQKSGCRRVSINYGTCCRNNNLVNSYAI